MKQPAIGHELVGLSIDIDSPDAYDIDDPPKLRKIVEAQAVELVKLRRALVASNSVSAERLQIIYRLHGEDVEREIKLKDTLGKISDLESDIYAIIKKSRWRKIGVKFGFESSQDWEVKTWRSRLVTNSEITDVFSDSEIEPPLSFALSEQNRLIKMWLQVSQSRWRRLGLKIRLVQELPLDIAQHGGFKHYAQFHLYKPQPELTSQHKFDEKKADYESFVEHTRSRFLQECQAYSVDYILDIGANIGQFGRGIRDGGYQGQIYSFESLSIAHNKLLLNAREDMLWHVVDRCVVGSVNTTAKINIKSNSFSSSILPMLPLHEEAPQESVYTDHEECSVITLATFIENTFIDSSATVGLKIDTLGYEHKVIEGLGACVDRVKVIVCKMSLRPLGTDSMSMPDLCRMLSFLGFKCVALGPKYERLATSELLQVDGLFIRN